ncbi:MAG: metallophosphoesterase [bacterium]
MNALVLTSVILIFQMTMVAQLAGQNNKPVRVGVFTDCQYCNCSPDESRNYKLSLPKLDSCIRVLNAQPLDAVFHLGDMIDRDFYSFDSIVPRFKQFRAPFHMVLGNHDYMIDSKYKPLVLDKIGMNETYYVVDLSNWRFIVLNGDDLSWVAPQDKQTKQERNDMVYNQFVGLHLNGMYWNGGVGSTQMTWLEAQLKESEKSSRNVVVICHFPLDSKPDHNLFNNREMLSLLIRYSCVKAYFNGHFHSGSYRVKEGLHLVNFKGMVDTDINAFAVVTLTSDSILIKGYGRETSRSLKIRPNNKE